MDETNSITMELGRYIEVLLRQWQLILSSMLICALAAGLVSFVQPKQYETGVLVATTKVASAVSFGSSIETMSEEQLLASGSGAYGLVDRKARLETYVQMVRNPAIANNILDRFGGRLGEEVETAGDLLKLVDAELASTSDAIRISVTYSDPVLAAEIANAWAEEYVQRVNQVYSTGSTDETFQSIKRQTSQVFEEYQAAQAELVSFYAQSRVYALERQIQEQQAVINGLSHARQNAIKTIVDEQAQSPVRVYNQQVQYLQARLKNAYDALKDVDRLTLDAENMRDQVRAGGEGAARSNATALTLLKIQVFSGNSESLDTQENRTIGTELQSYTNLQIQSSPVQVQAAPAEMTAGEMIADLDGLIATLENRRTVLEDSIRSLSTQLLDPQTPTGSGTTLASQAENVFTSLSNMEGLDGLVETDLAGSLNEQKIQALEQQVRDLQADLAAEMDRQDELIRARDLAYQTYTNLATKEAELSVASNTASTAVALASPAGVPDQDTVSGFRNVVVAAIAGLLLGVFAAYAIEFWWVYKGVEPEPIRIVPVGRRRHKEDSKTAGVIPGSD